MERIPVGKTDRNSGELAAVGSARRLSPAPPVRCSHRGADRSSPACGRFASFARLDEQQRVASFSCEDHARAGDVRLTEPTPVRLVRITCELLFIGVSLDAARSQAEAVATTETAALMVGGQLEIGRVTSSLARYYPAAAAVGEATGNGEG